MDLLSTALLFSKILLGLGLGILLVAAIGVWRFKQTENLTLVSESEFHSIHESENSNSQLMQLRKFNRYWFISMFIILIGILSCTLSESHQITAGFVTTQWLPTGIRILSILFGILFLTNLIFAPKYYQQIFTAIIAQSIPADLFESIRKHPRISWLKRIFTTGYGLLIIAASFTSTLSFWQLADKFQRLL